MTSVSKTKDLRPKTLQISKPKPPAIQSGVFKGLRS